MKKNNRKKSIILTGLILPIIVGIIVDIFTTIEVLNSIISAINFSAKSFFISLPIPVWLLISIIIISAGLGVGIVLYLYRVTEKESYKNYRKDRILGIDWQWNWYLGDMKRLIPLCPKCSYQPEIEREYSHSFNSKGNSKVECENCGFEKNWDMPPDKLRERVTKEIHRRLRTEEYL